MPAWSATAVDLFGPFLTRGETNKRSRGKAYGVLFNCVASRAVHVDIATDYSTEGFLMVLRRFVSIRGYPKLIFSCGSQLAAANKELKSIIEGVDKDRLREYGAEHGLERRFSAADALWQNGCSEALVKSVKKQSKLRGNWRSGSDVFELQTVCFEASNLVNERPIGIHRQVLATTNISVRIICFMAEHRQEYQVGRLKRQRTRGCVLSLCKD